MEFKHPKYYKELRKRNREVLRSGRGLAVNQAPHVSDQAISFRAETSGTSVRPGPGLKQRDSQVVNQVKLSSQSQAASLKQQAPSKPKPEPSSGSEAPSNKRQASSNKRQA